MNGMTLRKKLFSLIVKAMNALFCTLDKNEFNRIFICETTHDIWHTLEITHKGISRVKDSKVNLLMYDFELFCMKPSETIVDMYDRTLKNSKLGVDLFRGSASLESCCSKAAKKIHLFLVKRGWIQDYL